MSARVNLGCAKGEAYEGDGTHKTATDGSGVVVNITGWAIQFTLRKKAGDPDTGQSPLLQVSGVIVSGSAGTYTISLTSAQTKSIPAGAYDYDIWRTTTGSETQMAHGIFTTTQGVKFP
jgi:hypothetical protein